MNPQDRPIHEFRSVNKYVLIGGLALVSVFSVMTAWNYSSEWNWQLSFALVPILLTQPILARIPQANDRLLHFQSGIVVHSLWRSVQVNFKQMDRYQIEIKPRSKESRHRDVTLAIHSSKPQQFVKYQLTYMVSDKTVTASEKAFIDLHKKLTEAVAWQMMEKLHRDGSVSWLNEWVIFSNRLEFTAEPGARAEVVPFSVITKWQLTDNQVFAYQNGKNLHTIRTSLSNAFSGLWLIQWLADRQANELQRPYDTGHQMQKATVDSAQQMVNL